MCDQSAAMLPFLIGICGRIQSLDVLFEKARIEHKVLIRAGYKYKPFM